MKRSSRQLWVVSAVAVLVLFLIVLVVAGCGSSGSSSSGKSSPSASSGATVPAGEDVALHNLLPTSIQSAGVVRVASDIPYPPYEMYVGNTKQPTGYDYDLGQALGKVLGVKFQFMNAPFATIVMSVRTGKYDLFMTDMLDTAAREKVLDFVDYSYGAQSLMVLKGNPNGISNIDSLQGKTVACEIGTSAQLLLQQLNAQYKSAGKPQVAVLTFPTEAAALLALKANRVVAIMGGNSTNAYAAQTTNNGATFENLVDPAAPKGYEPQLVGIGISKTTPQLTTAVQKALQHLIDNGEYKTITDRYDLIPVDAAQINGASQVTPSASPTL